MFASLFTTRNISCYIHAWYMCDSEDELEDIIEGFKIDLPGSDDEVEPTIVHESTAKLCNKDFLAIIWVFYIRSNWQKFVKVQEASWNWDLLKDISAFTCIWIRRHELLSVWLRRTLREFEITHVISHFLP